MGRPSLRTGRAGFPHPALQLMVLPPRGLNDQGMGSFHTEQPMLDKVGVGPAMKVLSTPAPAASRAFAENAPQTHATLYTVVHAELSNKQMVWLEGFIVLFCAIDLLAIFLLKKMTCDKTRPHKSEHVAETFRRRQRRRSIRASSLVKSLSPAVLRSTPGMVRSARQLRPRCPIAIEIAHPARACPLRSAPRPPPSPGA